MLKIIRGLTLGVVLTLSLVATGADAFAAEINGADVTFVTGKPTPPVSPIIKPIQPLGVTWED